MDYAEGFIFMADSYPKPQEDWLDLVA